MSPKSSDIMAMVMVKDVQTCAGIVHVINKVLVPAASSSPGPAAALPAAATEAAAEKTCVEAVGTSIVNQCHGPDEAQQLPCCSAMAQCVQKDANYGQCRPVSSKIPEGWDGTILKYEAATVAASGPAAAAGATGAAAPVAAATPAAADQFTAYAGKDYLPGAANAVVVEVRPFLMQTF